MVRTVTGFMRSWRNSRRMHRPEKNDLEVIAGALPESGSYTGALDLDYREFARLYQYVSSLEERYMHPIQLSPAPDHTGGSRRIVYPGYFTADIHELL